MQARPENGLVLPLTKVAFALFLVSSALADQIQMQNGDRYIGHVVTLTNDILVLRSEVLGTIAVPRARIASISLGNIVPTNSAIASIKPTRAYQPAKSGTATNAPSMDLRRIGAETNLLQQVRQQYLGEAGPEANKKFDEMVQALIGGKLDMADLRAQAASAANQFRALKRDPNTAAETDGLDQYLSILDKFLSETTPSTSSATLSPAAKLRQSPPPSEDE